MARQPLIGLVPALTLALATCQKPLPYEGAFQLPIAAAVLQPEVGGPFLEPIGFVANGHGGQITPLSLKQGRLLTDDPTVSFLRTNPLATGGLRRLTGVAVVAPPERLGEVVVWAGDAWTGSLLRVPYLHDCDSPPERGPARECEGAQLGAPVEQAAWWELQATPGEEDRIEINDISVKKGYSTTESWTISYDDSTDDWRVEGSRSGLQPQRARTGQRYQAEFHRVGFLISGKPQRGDAFVVRTENGLSEHDVGGIPLAVSAAPDLSLLALIVHLRSTDRPVVRWFDPQTATVVGEIALAADAWPHRLAWSEDGALLITDRDHPAVWEVGLGEETALEHPMPWPTMDVASLDGRDRRRLFVVPLHGPVERGGPDTGRSELWLFDRDTDEPLDVNPAVEGVQGMSFPTTILGIEALRREHLQPEYTDDALRRSGRSVAVALANNRVVFSHEETGCLVQDNLGPRTEPRPQGGLGQPFDYETNFQTSVDNAALMEINGDGRRHVVVNLCAGIAQGEQWTLTFDQIAQAWRVEGSLSGVQQQMAIEGARYTSDAGEVSFTIRSGSTPSRDGWRIQFNVQDGVAEATGDNDLDGIAEVVLGITADPVYFEYRVGLPGPIGAHETDGVHEGEAWLPVDIRPFVLLPAASSNRVGRVDPQEARIEVGWE